MTVKAHARLRKSSTAPRLDGASSGFWNRGRHGGRGERLSRSKGMSMKALLPTGDNRSRGADHLSPCAIMREPQRRRVAQTARCEARAKGKPRRREASPPLPSTPAKLITIANRVNRKRQCTCVQKGTSVHIKPETAYLPFPASRLPHTLQHLRGSAVALHSPSRSWKDHAQFSWRTSR